MSAISAPVGLIKLSTLGLKKLLHYITDLLNWVCWKVNKSKLKKLKY